MSYQQMISAWRDRALALSFSFRARLLEKLQIVMAVTDGSRRVGQG
jgi:hypothetical protein